MGVLSWVGPPTSACPLSNGAWTGQAPSYSKLASSGHPSGSVTLCTPTLAPPPFQASLAFGPFSSNKKRRRRPGSPPSQTVFSP